MTRSADLPNEPLTMDCLLRHGLEQQPFDTVAGDTFLYTDPALDMVVGVLLEHLHNDDSLLILKGEHGAGKSTQLLRLLSRGAETLEFCAFKARPGTGFAAVDYTIRQYWKSSGGDTMPLDELLCMLAGKGRRPVLVIDDAHHLDTTVLTELSRLRHEVRQRCDTAPGLLLVGEPEIENLLEQAGDGDIPHEPRISVQLRPLTREQTEAYLRHRLQTAGADNPDLLAGETSISIHQESAGLPLGINAAANRILQAMVPPSGKTAPVQGSTEAAGLPAWKQRWFLPAVALVLGIGVLLTLINIVSSPDDPLETRELLVLPEPRPLPEPVAESEPPREVIPEMQFQSPPTAPEQAPEHEETTPLPEEDAVVETTPEPPSVPEPEPLPAEPPPGVAETPEPETTPEPAAPAQPPPTAEAGALRDAGWLRQQPAGHYTIQILGLSDLQALRSYGREHGAGMELAWFRTVRDGRDWFVLVNGSYPGPEAARAAISTLPEAVRRNQPWIRSFSSVHQAMDAVR